MGRKVFLLEKKWEFFFVKCAKGSTFSSCRTHLTSSPPNVFFWGGRGGRVPDVGVNCLSHSEHKNIRVRYSGTLVEVGGQQVKVQYEKVFISTYTNLDS